MLKKNKINNSMNNDKYIKITQPIVNFLQTVYDGNISAITKILVAQANQDSECLIAALEAIQDFVNKGITILNNIENDTDIKKRRMGS